MKYITCIGLLFLVAIVQVYAAGSGTTYRINTAFKAPVSDIFQLIVEDAFSRLDLKVDFREVSAERSLNLVNSGVDDGDCCRIDGINRYYPNLLQVPVKIIDIDFVAFTHSDIQPILGWSDLANYDVGVVRGWKILETSLQKHTVRRIYTLSSPQSLFGMLDKGRIQVATIGKLVGYQTLKNMSLKGIKAHAPPLVRKPLYLQMHRKHAGLAEKLGHVLKTMSTQGKMTEYYNKILVPLLDKLDSANMETVH